MQSSRPAPDVDGNRLMKRLHDLSVIGRDPTGGITRPGFSAAAGEANRFVGALAQQAGLSVSIDAGGNLILRRPSDSRDRPTLVLGSHLDTVVNGGWLDGAYGVLAGLEVLQVIQENNVELDFGLAVIAFANEEGALFPQPFWGSMVVAGLLDQLPADPTDYQGNPLAKALAETGGNMAELSAATWEPNSLLGYLELHIEQGPVLEDAGLSIGVVDAIVGRTVLGVEIRGIAAHAGTTPMESRSDALLAAARLALFTDQLPREKNLCSVATVGHLEVRPNSANTIVGTAHLTVDIRDATLDRMAAAEQAVRDELDDLAKQFGLEVQCDRLIQSSPALTDESLRRTIEASADDLGLGYRTMTSGAGHDAQIMAGVAPIGMIFVPSINGVSHVPDEDTSPADLVAGARVLLGSVLRMGPPNGDAQNVHPAMTVR
ncbi:M20 family metallo-hydrolase [Kibdelosporangium aridum]|uniref:M20 family metallo-hydrolase n=1 Tax=Kibdelosporangium aridum TaxID=2030 RepID=UPI0005265CD2